MIIGVHTPEFAFEHVVLERRGRGQAARDRLPGRAGQRLRHLERLLEPVLAGRVPDRPHGHVRHVRFGEGDYGETENAIRSLLGLSSDLDRARTACRRDSSRPSPTSASSGSIATPARRIVKGQVAAYTLPRRLPQNDLAYGGTWRVEGERIVAGTGRAAPAALPRAGRLPRARRPRPRRTSAIDGKPAATVTVDAYRLYTLHSSKCDRRRAARPALHARRSGVRVHVRLAR